MWSKPNTHAIFMIILFLCSETSFAGLLFTIGPNWNNFVFEAEKNEDTPNYYGYGARMSWGYSVAKVADFGIYAQYTPGRLNSATPPRTDAVVMDYGAELGLRVLNVFYLGARGGMWKYQLYRAYEDAEVRGSWMGLGGTASLGMIMPISKRSAWQTTFDVGQAVMQKLNVTPADADSNYRKLSRVGVTLSLVYNDDDITSVGSSLLKSFF
jgi:hypothetical protein